MMAKDKIRPAAIKVGIRLESGQRFGLHDFRHSLATFLINKGKDVKTIQGLFRHAKSSTTLHLYSQAWMSQSWRRREISRWQLRAVSSRPIKNYKLGRILLQLGILGSRSDEDGDVRVGVFPEREEDLVGSAGAQCSERFLLAGYGVRFARDEEKTLRSGVFFESGEASSRRLTSAMVALRCSFQIRMSQQRFCSNHWLDFWLPANRRSLDYWRTGDLQSKWACLPID